VDLAQTASELGIEILIPAAVLGQAWRGGGRSARLSILLAGSNVDALDEDRAKEVGVRLGERGGSDVADAHVVCCAIERDAMVLTSDPNDIAQLAEASEDLTVVSV
jgi:predicted nucleic acid-binding protein